MTADEYRVEAARLRNLARWVAYEEAPLRELASIFEALAKADDALARSTSFVATKRMLTAPTYSVFATAARTQKKRRKPATPPRETNYQKSALNTRER
jgi:hypothetical protein